MLGVLFSALKKRSFLFPSEVKQCDTAVAEITPTLFPFVRAQGYQRFPLSKPGVGGNIAFACCACLPTGLAPTKSLASRFSPIQFHIFADF